jgi:hypothetical protein
MTLIPKSTQRVSMDEGHFSLSPRLHLFKGLHLLKRTSE